MTCAGIRGIVADGCRKYRIASRVGVLTPRRHRLIQCLPLNQTPPFHVVEEECRMTLPGWNLAAGIETISVEPQLGNLSRRTIEIVTSVQRVIAQELPR